MRSGSGPRSFQQRMPDSVNLRPRTAEAMLLPELSLFAGKRPEDESPREPRLNNPSQPSPPRAQQHAAAARGLQPSPWRSLTEQMAEAPVSTTPRSVSNRWKATRVTGRTTSSRDPSRASADVATGFEAPKLSARSPNRRPPRVTATSHSRPTTVTWPRQLCQLCPARRG